MGRLTSLLHVSILAPPTSDPPTVWPCTPLCVHRFGRESASFKLNANTRMEWTIGPNEWTDEWTNGPNKWTSEWTNGPNEWIEWTNGPMNRPMNGPMMSGPPRRVHPRAHHEHLALGWRRRRRRRRGSRRRINVLQRRHPRRRLLLPACSPLQPRVVHSSSVHSFGPFIWSVHWFIHLVQSSIHLVHSLVRSFGTFVHSLVRSFGPFVHIIRVFAQLKRRLLRRLHACRALHTVAHRRRSGEREPFDTSDESTLCTSTLRECGGERRLRKTESRVNAAAAGYVTAWGW